jgi:hypothetical protein
MKRTPALKHVLAAASLLIVTGCNGAFTLPLAPGRYEAPSEPAPAAGPEILVVEASSATTYRAATDSTVAIDTVVDRSLTVTGTIDGKYGGRLRCGRFVLVVPPLAWIGKGDVTMSMADSTVMLVDLGIYPTKLNAFTVPVELCLVTEGTSVSVDNLAMYWWDPAKSTWMAQTCDKDLTDNPELILGENYTNGMVIQLNHFSRYSGGKAGW